jgi:GT2 family glycosyltransferase
MTKNLTLSVCIATYNGSQHIERQLRSILVQIGVNDEVIIVDDCSTDNTISIIKNLKDDRIKIYLNPKNIGVVQTFGRALSLAEGDLILLSDQDDFWYSDKVMTVTNIFSTQSLGLLVHNARIVNNDVIISHSLFNYSNSGYGILKNIISNTYTGCCMSFRRELLPKILPIPSKKGLYHDAWIGIISEFSGFKTVFLNIPLIEWNRHGGNVSVTKRRDLFTIVFERYLLIISIFRRLVKNVSFT